jgi:predicted AAA+ superfamily ATPase
MKIHGHRYLNAEIAHLLQEKGKMAFVAGPRQVGKTTLARHLLADSETEQLYFNWDIETHRILIVREPEDFWQSQEGVVRHPRPRMVLDEIHKFPRWKRFLKGLSDEHGQQAEIVVTGSGRLDMHQRKGDSLFGRFGLFRLHPFTLGELLAEDRQTVVPPEEFWERLKSDAPSAQAEERLRDLETLTGFPEPLFSGSQSRLISWRQAHRRLVVREDLRDLTRIRDIGVVEMLTLLLPERVGLPLSTNALSEDLGVSFATVKGYMEILSRLYYLFAVSPYSSRLARTIRRTKKVYLFDYTEVDNPGARFENMVALHLKKLTDAWTDFGYGEFDLRYVRDRERREVSFLITEGRKPYALIQSKLSGRDVDPSLHYFANRLKPRYAVQVVRMPVPASKMLALM